MFLRHKIYRNTFKILQFLVFFDRTHITLEKWFKLNKVRQNLLSNIVAHQAGAYLRFQLTKTNEKQQIF